MKKRLEYIDSVKGFAIFLVVMAHVIHWSYASFDKALSMSQNPVILFQVIYSFHMPLFMFISGFLFGFSHFDKLKDYWQKMYKKAIMLIIPYFVCGILVYMWRGVRELTYWYLLTLFQCLLIVGLENYFFDKIRNRTYQIIVEVVTLVSTHIFIHFFTKLYDSECLYLYNWYPSLKWMFGYFALGSFLSRHFDISKILDNRIYSIFLLFFVTSFVIDIPHTNYLSISLRSIAAIYCCLYLFINCFISGTVIEYLKRIGKKTMHIYILHIFFSIKLTQVGDFFLALVQGSKIEFVTEFVLQLVFSLLLSLLIIELSIFVGKLIRTSNLLSCMLLGEETNRIFSHLKSARD